MGQPLRHMEQLLLVTSFDSPAGFGASLRTHERTDGRTDKRTDRRTDGRMDKWTDGWMDGQMGGWMDRRMDESISLGNKEYRFYHLREKKANSFFDAYCKSQLMILYGFTRENQSWVSLTLVSLSHKRFINNH